MKETSVKKVVRTYCKECYMECGVQVTVKDGKVVRIKGDSECPLAQGKVCPMGSRFIEGTLYHPDRLKYPMKRDGDKGEGKWKRISWDEVVDEVAEKILDIREKYGPLSLACAVDGWHYVLTGQLIRALGSPNMIASMQHCEGPGSMIDSLLIGSICTQFGRGPDCKNSKCILVWGKNPADTHPPLWRFITQAMSKGAKLIVIDPRRTPIATKADIWLQPRPGSDGALTMAMLNVIINEGLFDKDFISKWCFGFEKLRERVQEYPPEEVEKITWTPADEIRKAARLYATIKPASLVNGIGIMQQYGSTATAHAQVCLVAITGNIDIKGGNLLMSRHVPLGYITAYKFIGQRNPEHLETEEIAAKRVGAEEFPLWAGRMSYISASHEESLVKAMLTGKPYPVRALILHGQNLVVQCPNAREVYEALRSLDLLVAFNYMMTPTMQLADYVLPVATWIERDELPLTAFVWWNRVMARRKVIEPVGESRDEAVVALELYKKLRQKGLEPAKSRTGEDFIKWQTLEEFLNYCLKGLGLTWDQLKEEGSIQYPIKFKAYEDGGFHTPSGKIELYSNTLKEFGYDPLPHHREPPESPISTPELTQEYPLILTTARVRGGVFFHSSNRWAAWARKIHPDPVADIHPQTAEERGITNGDWIWIETPRGRIKQTARVTDRIHPKVVSVEPSWWFPEKGAPMYGCFDSNINVLTPSDGPYDPIEGTSTLRVQLCKVYKES